MTRILSPTGRQRSARSVCHPRCTPGADAAGSAPRAKSDADYRAAVNELYDHEIFAKTLEQLKADAIIYHVRERRCEREEMHRAIRRKVRR